MPKSTFDMSCNEHIATVPLPHRDMQLVLSSESPYNNGSLSPSPNSSSSVSTNRETSSSPDIHMPDHCITEGFLLDSLQITPPRQDNLFCDSSIRLSQTCINTLLEDHVNFCNKNLSSQDNQETEEYLSFGCNKGDVASAGIGEESQQSSCDISQHGSTENNCCSMSSGEMVMRSNSFCLADQSLSVFSSFDDSSISPATAHAEFLDESKILSTLTLPDVCENVAEVTLGNPYLGKTFILADNWELPEEDSLSTAPSPGVRPGGNPGDLFMTFLCGASPDDKKQVQLTCMEAEVAHFSAEFTPEKGTTFVPTMAVMQNSKTSTPEPNTGTKILPSHLESTCFEDNESPRSLPVEKQQTSVTPTQNLAVGLSPSPSKVKQNEIKKCPKSDLRNVKSKVVTRTVDSRSSPQHKQLQAHLHSNPIGTRCTNSRIGRAAAFLPATARREINVQKQVIPRAVHLGVTIIQSPKYTVGNEKGKSSISSPASKIAQTPCCSTVSSEKAHTASSQKVDIPAQCTGDRISSSEKPSAKSGKKDSELTPKKHMSNKIEVKAGSALSYIKTRHRCSSESLSSLLRPPKQRKAAKFSTTIVFPRHEKPSKTGILNNSSQSKVPSQTDVTKRPADDSPREVIKISLVTESGRAPGSSLDQTKSKARGQTVPRQSRATSLFQPPTASQSIRQRQGSSSNVDFRVSKGVVGTPQSKQNSIAGSQRTQATGEQSLAPASSASVKYQLNGPRPAQTPSRPSLMGPLLTPASRLPRKTLLTSRSQHVGSVGSDQNEASGGTPHRQIPLKTVVPKPRLISNPVKNNGTTSVKMCSTVVPPATNTNKGSCTSTVSLLKRALSSRLTHPTPSRAVDKNKAKASCRQQPPLQQVETSQSKQNTGRPDVVPPSLPQGDTKDQRIQHLTELLAASSCRFEAVTVVLQKTLAERDESMGRCKELSEELVSLRGELVCSVKSFEQLEKEKQDLQNALDNTMERLQKQHQKDLEDMEHRLQVFYQVECDKIHLSYQEEANKCRALLQQQMEALEVSHKSMKVELEKGHVEQLQCVKQQHEQSLQELGNIHNQQLESLEASLKDAEAALSARIEVLTQENAAMIEKLTAEENKRIELAESQKDSHTVYLEQELESLKVVLDIKNKQLHQQEKKMMEIDKLMEKNVKLDESLKRVQQENEDLKARMERHAALSRQLSTEQAVLQQSLQKESKVNKRLSMENEELLWKLHNGDVSSPNKMSPTSTSPSHSFSFQSPRSPGACFSPPFSPR
ncbi:microtubule-associated tumor suppressor 1 homolog A isoform X1 [Nerophis lumbriciformis]|uniref:microtubule-associated tumor suppressor 1 homolog A isoform X1 n=1 Tax=Nerophis lumbriciformis TaxID=546530 RepID=UPI003BABD704